ncbi:MAG: TIR domain-containing protein [Methanolobus sp.]|jgi:DNA-directed RNA polymerase subunit L|nr:TIR domain-containing protein [Methanolobus sp.]
MGGGMFGNRTQYAPKRYGLSEKAPQQSLDYKPKPRVFISFHMEDKHQVNLLRYQSKNSDQLEFTDYSVKEPFDEKWKTQCTERIKQSSVLVVAIGEDTHKREAVLWEIKKAHELGKPVIGMRIYNDKNHTIPAQMREHGDRVVSWNLNELQNEIDMEMARRG